MTRKSLRERNAAAIAGEADIAPAPAEQPSPAPLVSVPTHTAPEPGPQAPQETAERPPEPRPASRTINATAKASRATRPAAGQGRLVLWTPTAIRARMQAEQRRTGKVYRDQVLDSIEATYEQLPDLVATPEGDATVQGQIFERAAKVESAEHRVQLTITGVLSSQLAAIDQLVISCGAASRSALVNAALNAHLPG